MDQINKYLRSAEHEAHAAECFRRILAERAVSSFEPVADSPGAASRV